MAQTTNILVPVERQGYRMETRRKKGTKRQKNIFSMTSGGFVIVVRNNSFIDSK